MKDEKRDEVEAARSAVWDAVVKAYPSSLYSSHLRRAFNQTWDAGFDAGRSRWVDSQERLPDEPGEYIVQLRNGEVAIRWINVSDPDYCRIYFKYWQPKPDPYTEAPNEQS